MQQLRYLSAGAATRHNATAIGVSAPDCTASEMLQRSLLRRAPPRHGIPSPCRGDTRPLQLTIWCPSLLKRRSSCCDHKRGQRESQGSFILKACWMLAIASTPDLTSSRQLSRVEYKFIQNHFHPKRANFIQNHFHPNTTFIPKQFHPKSISSQKRF